MPPSDASRRNGGRNASIDLRIAELAARQHAVVHLLQLLRLGLSPSAVRSRVATGRLHLIHRGVYAVGHPLLSREGEWLAAVFAAGPGAVLSHMPAAEHHGALQSAGTIHVSVPLPGGRQRRGFQIHRVAPMHPDDHGRLNGIPVTSLPRALIDSAVAIGQRGVERAIAEGQFRRVYEREAMVAALGRATGRRGAGIVREVLRLQGIEGTLTNRELEERFLRLVRRAGFPLPRVNFWVTVPGGSFKCDFVWWDLRLIVETDGRGPHTRDLQFEEDRRRDSILKLGGWEVVRFTWRQVVDKPDWVVSMVRQFYERQQARQARALSQAG